MTATMSSDHSVAFRTTESLELDVSGCPEKMRIIYYNWKIDSRQLVCITYKFKNIAPILFVE